MDLQEGEGVLQKKIAASECARKIVFVGIAVSAAMVFERIVSLGLGISLLGIGGPEILVASLALLITFLLIFIVVSFHLSAYRSGLVALEQKLLQLQKKRSEEPVPVAPLVTPIESKITLGKAFSYISPSVMESLSNIDKVLFQDPLKVVASITQVQKIWLPLIDLEVRYSGHVEEAIKTRCSKEFSYILLGFLSIDQLRDIDSKYEKVRGRKAEKREQQLLYAECIKKYPQLIVAEAAYFMWLRESYPYLGRASESIFRRPSDYISERPRWLQDLLSLFSSNDKEIMLWLQKFSGWGPVCLASFRNTFGDGKLLQACRERLDWGAFCKQVSEFCRLAIFRKGILGDWKSFMEYISNREKSNWLTKDTVEFVCSEEDEDFFDSPRSLWDMQELVDQDPELAAKIEEGLSMLSDAGYLGSWSIGRIQSFEKTILGLSQQES